MSEIFFSLLFSWMDRKWCHLPYHWWAWPVLSCILKSKILNSEYFNPIKLSSDVGSWGQKNWNSKTLSNFWSKKSIFQSQPSISFFEKILVIVGIMYLDSIMPFQAVNHLHVVSVLMTVVLIISLLSCIAIVRRILMATSVLKVSSSIFTMVWKIAYFFH